MVAVDDHYAVLNVNRNVAAEELRKAFKVMAMRWHPDKNRASQKSLAAAEARFKQVSEAYNVLSDPQKRRTYDLSLPEEISGFPKSDPPCSPPPPKAGGSNKRKAAAVENKLGCSLEELYTGCKKKVKISWPGVDCFGHSSFNDDMLTVDIKPGFMNATKITYPMMGRREPGMLPGDLIFHVEEKPHAIFRRIGRDLIMRQKITLLEALTGKVLSLTALDGRRLTIPVGRIPCSGHEVVVPDEGMPNSKEAGKRGTLRIRFNVVFPTAITEEQESDLRRLLVAD